MPKAFLSGRVKSLLLVALDGSFFYPVHQVVLLLLKLGVLLAISHGEKELSDLQVGEKSFPFG